MIHIKAPLYVLLLSQMIVMPVLNADLMKNPCPVHAKHACWVDPIAFGAPVAADWKKFEDVFDAAALLAKMRGETWTRAYGVPIAGVFRRNGPTPFNYCGEGDKGPRSNKLGVMASITYYAPGEVPPVVDPPPRDTGDPPPAARIGWSNVVNGCQFDPDAFRVEYPRDGYDPQHPDWFGDSPCHPCVEYWKDTFLSVAFTKVVSADGKTTNYTFDQAHAWTWGYEIHCKPVPAPAAAALAILGLIMSGVIVRLHRRGPSSPSETE